MIKFTLKDTLKKYGISGNRLSVESKVRSNTIYDLINGKAPSISFDTLINIVKALRKLTRNNDINVNDVFVYGDNINH